MAVEAASGAGRTPARLALALKAGRRLARIAVYHLTAGGGAGVPLGATARLLGQMELTSALPVQVPHSLHSQVGLLSYIYRQQ